MRDINKRRFIPAVLQRIPDLTDTQAEFVRNLLSDITIGQYNGPEPEDLI